jgi:SAM-dependent methyltransferase
VVTAFPDLWQQRLPQARIVADDEVLDLTPGAHDLVIHALCLHWANDPVGQLVQCRRALRPDGLFLGVLFGGQTLAELRACLAQAEAAVTGGLSPRVLPMGEIRDLGGLLQRAGFALPVADAATRTVTYADPLRLMADLRAMGEGNALSQRLRRPTRRAVFAQAAELYAQTHAGRGRADQGDVRDDLPDRLGARRKPAEAAAPRIGGAAAGGCAGGGGTAAASLGRLTLGDMPLHPGYPIRTGRPRCWMPRRARPCRKSRR